MGVDVLVGLALMALVRNRIRYVSQDPELGIGEPWLLVDSTVGLEKLLANCWLLFLVLAPWLIGAGGYRASPCEVPAAVSKCRVASAERPSSSARCPSNSAIVPSQ